MFLVVVQVIATGITEPTPKNLELLPGEEGRFYFQVQSVADPKDLECTVSVKETNGLEVEFDIEVISIGAGEVDNFLGTVIVPRGTAYANYEVKFCVNCGSPIVGEGVNPVKISTCGLDFNVDVVAERTRSNIPLPPKPTVDITLYVIVLVILVLIAVGVVEYLRRKNKKRKK